jgi:dienelactone hydrolase
VKLSAQSKLPIDSIAFNNWPQIGYPAISNDGRYIFYSIEKPVREQSTFEVIDRILNKKKIYNIAVNTMDAAFTSNNRFLVIRSSDNCLSVLNLETGILKFIDSANAVIFPREGLKSYCTYRTPKKEQVILYNILSGKRQLYEDVKELYFDRSGLSVLIFMINSLSATVVENNLITSEQRVIFKGQNLSELKVDNEEENYCFLSGKDSVKYIYIYSLKNKRLSKVKLPDNIANFTNQSHIREYLPGLHSILFDFEYNSKTSMDDSSGLQIWRYNDSRLKSERFMKRMVVQTYSSLYDYEKQKFYEFTKSGEREIFNNNLFAVINTTGNLNQNRCTIISKANGIRENLSIPSDAYGVRMSPDGNFLLYYNQDQNSFYSYEFRKKILRKLYNVRLRIDMLTVDDLHDSNFKYLTWMAGQQKVFIRDRHDIWLLDLNGSSPRNLTNNFGKNNSLIFSLTSTSVKENDNILVLQGFNELTKQVEFYNLNLLTTELKCLSKKDWCIGNIIFASQDSRSCIITASEKGSSINLFYTNDFINFSQISFNYPENSYNWYDPHLMSWKQPNGINNQGILYKPRDFDSIRKYPVIFYFYEKISQNLNLFLPPELSVGLLNIPEYISSGYLVFTPDIHYQTGNIGENAVDAVVSAANMLKNYAFVDSSRMGIQGHSLGGFEVNYIISHTNIFAAACSAAGICDWFSFSGSLRGDQWDGEPREYIQNSQPRLRNSQWQRPDLYTKNSPVFFADKVTTPILLFHNNDDYAVPFNQGMEWFTALKYCGKVAYLLQYKDEGHFLLNEFARKDYTAKMKSFFDHYLKGFLPPAWMVNID